MTTVGQLIFSGILIGSIYALMSIGLTLIFGVLRIVNFAHGEFLMIAMYGAWAMTRFLGLNPYIAVVAVVPAMFLFGGLVHRLIISPGLDKPHLVVVFATMGLVDPDAERRADDVLGRPVRRAADARRPLRSPSVRSTPSPNC